MKTLIGYIRAPKIDTENLADIQRRALVSAGVSPDNIFEDVAARRQDSLPMLQRCLDVLQPGDTLMIWRLDRVGRDLRHLVNLVNDLVERRVELKILSGAGTSIDTTVDGGKQVLSVFSGLAEFERELITEGQRSGGATASHGRGHRGGRAPKMTPAKIELARAAMARTETNVGALCLSLGITRQTLYRFVGPTGELRADGMRVLKGSSEAGRLHAVSA